MSTTGFRQFDETIQNTHIWLNEICDDIGPDKQVAYHALRAVLMTLRDRLTPDESAHLAAQLPMLIRGIYYDGYRPAEQPHKERSLDEFLQHVEERMGDVRATNIEEATRAVLKTLGHRIAPGEVEQVRAMLPEDIRRVWPAQ